MAGGLFFTVVCLNIFPVFDEDWWDTWAALAGVLIEWYTVEGVPLAGTSSFGVGLLVGVLCLSVACLNNIREVVPQVVPQSSNNDEVISDTEGIRVSLLVEDNDMPLFVFLDFLILDEAVAFDNSFKIDNEGLVV